MAFPFSITSLATYLRWAQSVGCECVNGYGGPAGAGTFWKITAPSGRHVYVVDMDQREGLVSSMLDHLDRRLGITSPFDRVRPYDDAGE